MVRALAALVVSLLGAISATHAREAAQGHDWTVYRNHRYGFSIDYPGDVFQLERATEADDGQVFVSREGDARLLIGTISNIKKLRPAAYRDHIAKDFYAGFATTYRRLSGRTFELSGKGKGKTFYEMVAFNCDGQLISSFAMIYPSDRQNLFHPLIEIIEKSFRPNFTTKCGNPAHGGAQRLRGLPRSEAADQTTQSRRRNIPVALRRSDHLYENKIIRGYGRPYMGR